MKNLTEKQFDNLFLPTKTLVKVKDLTFIKRMRYNEFLAREYFYTESIGKFSKIMN